MASDSSRVGSEAESVASVLALHGGAVWDSVSEQVLESGCLASPGATRVGEAVSAVGLSLS